MATQRPRTLSATFVRKVSQPGTYGDGRGGHGLALRVWITANGRIGKTWTQRMRINGRLTNIGLGGYPVVTLAEARAKALESRRAVARGLDPRTGGLPTFEQAAEKVIALRRRTWKGTSSERQWRSDLKRYVLPKIGKKPVNEVASGDVLDIIAPIWQTQPVTARRVRNRLSAVMRWAVAKNFRQDDPAGEAVTAALPRKGAVKTVHYQSLPHAELGAMLERVEGTGCYPTTALALRFIALTATRSGEALGAKWEEIDGDVWTIPAVRMKVGKEHRVPLSSGALAVLEEARRYSDASGLVFPSARSGKQISRAVFSSTFRRHGIPATLHGLRSSFRDWCAETGVAREVAEASLAHVVKSMTERAYLRSDLLERRREVMQDWSDYLAP